MKQTQTSTKLQLSYSKINTFLHCRKKYYFNYEEKLIPKESTIPLQVGDIVHQLLHKHYMKELDLKIIENLDEHVKRIHHNENEEINFEVAQQAASLFTQYLKTHEPDFLKVISSEFWCEVELSNCILVGKVDALAKDVEGKLWRVEHKTASRVDNAYLQGLKHGLQGAIYDYLVSNLISERLQGTIYNMLVKTKIPKFPRVPNLINPSLQVQMLQTVKGVADSIERCKQNDEYYPSCSCFLYGRECDYRPLCNFDSAEVRKAFYKPKEEAHERGTL